MPRLILGFTGTRKLLTLQQNAALQHFLVNQLGVDKICSAIHGGCTGADMIFHDLCLQYKIWVEIYPSPKQAHQTYRGICRIHPITPGSPLKRNRIIVARLQHLVACPKEQDEVKRSGTWATVRYARAANKPITFIFPSGEIRHAAP